MIGMTEINKYTATIVETPTGFVGIVNEIPGAASFANTKKQLMKRLLDAAEAMKSAISKTA